MRRALIGMSASLALMVSCLGLAPPGAHAQSRDPFQPPESSAAEESRRSTGADTKADSGKDSRSTPRESDRVIKSLEQWQKQLTHEQFMVTRMKATEAPFSGKYAHGHWKGTFLCVCCGAKLFESGHKFDSGTGWPSFDRPAGDKALETAWDYSEAEARIEVTCRKCGAHLGHVFQDGPTPTGLRFCINSLALKLDPEKQPPAPARKAARSQASRATRKPVKRPTTEKPAAETEKPASEEPTKQDS